MSEENSINHIYQGVLKQTERFKNSMTSNGDSFEDILEED